MHKPFMFFLSLLALVFSASAIEQRGGYLMPEIVKVSECKPIASGIFKTGTLCVWCLRNLLLPDTGLANGRTVSLSSSGLTFSSDELQVEFQSCQPNFGGFDGSNNSPLGGRRL